MSKYLYNKDERMYDYQIHTAVKRIHFFKVVLVISV